MDEFMDLDVSAANPEKKIELLRYAVEVRKSEIDRLWVRSAFFWAFIGAAFVAYGALIDKANSLLAVFIGCFGLICSFAWTLQNRGSKYWQEAWENKVEKIEYHVLKARLFSNKEPLQIKGPFSAKRYSVSRLVIALSDFTVAIWLVLVVNGLYSISDDKIRAIALVASAITIAYAGYIAIWCKSK